MVKIGVDIKQQLFYDDDMSNLKRTTRKASDKVAVIVMKGDVLVERGQYWPHGAGLSIAIEDENLRGQVESGVRFLMADSAAISANLECGWEVALVKEAR